MSKHTPGPWFAVQYANWFNIQTTEEYSASDVLDLECCEEAEANARLAAAAPELLEELKHCREWHKHHVDLIRTYGSKAEHMLMHHRDQIASITATIAKAEPAAESEGDDE